MFEEKFIARHDQRSNLIVLAMLCCLTGCPSTSNDQAPVTVDLTIRPAPARVGVAHLILDVKGANGEPLKGASLEVEGNMNHAGMKPAFGTLKETEAGRYEGELEFTMGGDWFLLITGRTAAGEEVSKKVDVPGVLKG